MPPDPHADCGTCEAVAREVLCRVFDDGAEKALEEWHAWYDPTAWLWWGRALGAFIRQRLDQSKLRHAVPSTSGQWTFGIRQADGESWAVIGLDDLVVKLRELGLAAKLAAPVASAVEQERQRCMLDACYWCKTGFEPFQTHAEIWEHEINAAGSAVRGLTIKERCGASKIRARAFALRAASPAGGAHSGNRQETVT